MNAVSKQRVATSDTDFTDYHCVNTMHAFLQLQVTALKIAVLEFLNRPQGGTFTSYSSPFASSVSGDSSFQPITITLPIIGDTTDVIKALFTASDPI
jgi:hypothetical protein